MKSFKEYINEKRDKTFKVTKKDFVKEYDGYVVMKSDFGKNGILELVKFSGEWENSDLSKKSNDAKWGLYHNGKRTNSGDGSQSEALSAWNGFSKGLA